MIISIVSLLLLAVAAYFLIKTKPNLFLFELMKEAFGDAKDNHSESAEKSRNKKSCGLNNPQ
ncbi:MAG: hypothetical protein FJ240_04435 [Nitrospira sp.]|nr:hypothetical protein [Nitrospira sp.]